MKSLAAIVGLVVTQAAASGQSASLCDASAAASAPRFIECARTAAEKYVDRSKAIADGYRPIGRDFPAMGEHWIRIGLVFDAKIDPARPEVLNYVLVDGRPKLVGLGFAMPLLAGETAPEAPAGRDAWHDHFRTIEDETVQPHTNQGHAQHGVEPGPRLALLHTWLWAPNPDGVFAADNWALPYVRLGLPVPADGTPSAAKALSLLTGGADYFARLLAAEPSPAPRDNVKIRAVLEDARTKAEAIVRARRGTELSAVDLFALASLWNETMRTLNGIY